MDLFKPSRKLLEKICDEGNYLSNYEIYLREDIDNNIQRVYNSFFPSLDSKLSHFYKFGSEKHHEFFQPHFVLVEEIFKNCCDHSKGDVEIGMFFGDKGVCYGFCDGGDYFKDDKIKYQYENKIPLTNLKPKTEYNRRIGTKNIFSKSDLIEVDSIKGILYCVLLN